MHLKLLLDLSRSIEELCRHVVDLALDVKLVAFDLDNRPVALSHNDQALSGQVLIDFFDSLIKVGNVDLLNKLGQVHGLARQSGLHLKDVQKGLSAYLRSVRSQKDILACLLLHLVGKSDCFVKLEVFEQGLGEPSEAIRVVLLLSENERQCDVLQCVRLQWRDLHSCRLANLDVRLVIGPAKQEGSDHVPHQVLTAQLNHIEVRVAKVRPVSQHGSEHTVGVLGSEAEDKGPVE